MANLLFATRESDSLRSENPGMSQPSSGLVLAGSPIDLDAAPSHLVEAARMTELKTFEQIVYSGGGRVLGQAVLGFWNVRDLDRPAVADILQTDLSREMLERFLNWHRWTVNLPGDYYLQVVRELFRDIRLARNSLEALGRVVDLGAVRAFVSSRHAGRPGYGPEPV